MREFGGFPGTRCAEWQWLRLVIGPPRQQHDDILELLRLDPRNQRS